MSRSILKPHFISETEATPSPALKRHPELQRSRESLKHKNYDDYTPPKILESEKRPHAADKHRRIESQLQFVENDRASCIKRYRPRPLIHTP